MPCLAPSPGNYGNRLMCGLLEGQLGRGTLVMEGQGGQQQNNGKQIGHQSFSREEGGRGNAGMLAAQQAGAPLHVWLKVQYGLMHAGLFTVGVLL